MTTTDDIHSTRLTGPRGLTIGSDPRVLQAAAWAIMQRSYEVYVMAQIYSRFDATTAAQYERHLCAVMNPLARIASLLSVTYTTPVSRDSGDGALNAAVRDHVGMLDVALGEAERLKNGLGDAFLIPYWDEAAEQVQFRLFGPHEWDVVRDDQRQIAHYEHIPAGVRYRPDGWITRKLGDAWSEPEFLSKVCPVVWFRLNPMADLWSVNEIRDLIVGTIETGTDETMNKLSAYFRSFRQAFLKSAGLTAAQVQSALESMDVGIDKLLEREIDTVELADPKNTHYDTIRRQVADLAATRGISMDSYFSTGAQQVFSPELRATWRAATKYQLVPELQLLRAVVAILVKNGIVPTSALSAQWRIDYHEPTPEQADPMRKYEILAKAIELGQDSPIEAILRDDRECVTREDAKALLEQRAEDRLELKRLMIERNQSGDPANTDTATPQENGAAGGQISAQLRAEVDGTYDGAGGPSVAPKDI